MHELNKKMAKGALWMVNFKLLERSIGLISTIILARILIPGDFGLVAMAMSIIAVLELLSAFNFDVTLIQNQSATRDHYDTAWTLNVLFGVASAIILVLLAAPAAAFYEEPRLAAVIHVLAFSRFVQGFQNIGIVAFRKEMEFNKEFKFLLSKKLVGFFTTIPLALTLNSYWALIAGIVVSNIFATILSFFVNDYRPRLSLSARHDLFNFSKWLLINNVMFFLKLRSADFIVGKIVGSTGLGLHTIAYEISNLPTTELVAPINRAVFPGYAKMSNDLAQLRQGYLNVISVIVMAALPAAAGIAAVAELLVPVVLGEKWLRTIPLIEVLAIFGALSAIQTNIGSVYLAMGRPRTLTYLGMAYLAVFIPFVVVLTSRYGVVGTAWAYLASASLLLPVNYIVMFRMIELQPSRFFAVIWRPLLATLVMYTAVRLAMQALPAGIDASVQLAALVGLSLFGAVLYAVSLLLLWRLSGNPDGAEQFMLDKLGIILRTKLAFLK